MNKGLIIFFVLFSLLIVSFSPFVCAVESTLYMTDAGWTWYPTEATYELVSGFPFVDSGFVGFRLEVVCNVVNASGTQDFKVGFGETAGPYLVNLGVHEDAEGLYVYFNYLAYGWSNYTIELPFGVDLDLILSVDVVAETFTLYNGGTLLSFGTVPTYVYSYTNNFGKCTFANLDMDVEVEYFRYDYLLGDGSTPTPSPVPVVTQNVVPSEPFVAVPSYYMVLLVLFAVVAVLAGLYVTFEREGENKGVALLFVLVGLVLFVILIVGYLVGF